MSTHSQSSTTGHRRIGIKGGGSSTHASLYDNGIYRRIFTCLFTRQRLKLASNRKKPHFYPKHTDIVRNDLLPKSLIENGGGHARGTKPMPCSKDDKATHIAYTKPVYRYPASGDEPFVNINTILYHNDIAIFNKRGEYQRL